MKRLLPPIALGALILYTGIYGGDWWLAMAAFALGIWGALYLKRPWPWKAITFALPLLGFSTALWASPVIALFAGIVLWMSFLCFTDRFPWARTTEERESLGTTLFVFVLFLNFFTFRSNFPMFSGLASVAAFAGVFCAVSAHLFESFGMEKRTEAFVLTFLLTEAIYFLYFLPSGYFSLAIAASVWYFALLDLYVKLTHEPRRLLRKLLPEIAGALLLIFAVIVSSGLRAR